MKQYVKQLIMAFAVVIGVAVTGMATAPVGAVNVIGDACTTDPSSEICAHKEDNVGNVIKIVVNTLLFIVGAISVVMIIVGGLRYTTSGGDQKAVTDAKNTILYAVIGLVVAFLAFAIVNWVLTAFK